MILRNFFLRNFSNSRNDIIVYLDGFLNIAQLAQVSASYAMLRNLHKSAMLFFPEGVFEHCVTRAIRAN